MPTPAWLQNLTPAAIEQGPFPLQEVLHESVYYPAAGTDGHDIELLSQHACSFIHVDFRETQKTVRAQLLGTPGFAGYDLVGLRNVSVSELTPDGWQPSAAPQVNRPLPESASPANSFALWAVFERQAAYPPEHGSDRFSLLHLHAEGLAAYDALYLSNKAQAKYLCIIQPSEGFGDNPYRFTDPAGPFHDLVSSNPLGLPEFLVRGGGGLPEFYTQQASWAEYTQLMNVRRFAAANDDSATLAVWAL